MIWLTILRLIPANCIEIYVASVICIIRYFVFFLFRSFLCTFSVLFFFSTHPFFRVCWITLWRLSPAAFVSITPRSSISVGRLRLQNEDASCSARSDLVLVRGWNKKLFTNLMQLNIYLCSFSSTCFGLIRPSSRPMDVTISLHMQHMVSLV